MPPYAYPIRIRRKPQPVLRHDAKEFETLSLAILQPFVGDLGFDVTEAGAWGGYIISVTRSKLETPEECASRVAREVEYMKEFKKRKAAGEKHTGTVDAADAAHAKKQEAAGTSAKIKSTYPAYKKAVNAAFKSPASNPGVCFHLEKGWITESLNHPRGDELCRFAAYRCAKTGNCTPSPSRKTWDLYNNVFNLPV